MSTYLLTFDELWIHGYPRPKNGNKNEVDVNPDVVKRYKNLVTGHPTKRKCSRCQAEVVFIITLNPMTLHVPLVFVP